MNGRTRRLRQFGLCLLLLCGCGKTSQQVNENHNAAEDVLERVAEQGPVRMVVRVSPREPRLSDVLDLELQITAPARIEIEAPTFGQAVGDFLVRDYTERPRTTADDGHVTRRFDYKLEPVSAGRHLIRSFDVDFVDQRPESEQPGAESRIESPPIEISVTSELGDQLPDLAKLEPMVPPRPLTVSTSWGWITGIAIVGLWILLSLAWWWRRRCPRVAAEPGKTPEEIAHAAIAALLAEELTAQGRFKEFYLRLTGIVRQFIEDTTGLRAPEQTTEEFLQAMRTRNVFSLERSQRLKEFLEAADMVKFAGQQPDGAQIELSIARAREFVAMHSNVVEQGAA